jgi:hypothetical protein
MRSLGCGFATGTIAIAIAAASSGCSDGGAASGAPTATAQPAPTPTHAPTAAAPVVTGWQASLQQSTVSLYKEHSFCTGTWVSAHAVLTAAHCVEEMDPTTFYVVPGPDATNPAVKLKTGGFYIHPSYLAARRQNSAVALAPQMAADLAVVSVPNGKPEDARLVILDFEHSVRKQASYRVAGFGHTGRKDGVAQGAGVLRNGTLTALYKFANKDAGAKAAGTANAAGGANAASAANAGNAAGGATGHYWVLDGAGTVEVCQGDSGGPAFWVSGNDVMQFGVTSYIMPGTASDVADIQRLGDKADRGELWSPEELTLYGKFLANVKDVQERGCSRLVAVASVGEMRDWIKARSDEIEHDAGAR